MTENLSVWFLNGYKPVNEIKEKYSPAEINHLFLTGGVMAGELLVYAGYTKHPFGDTFWEEVTEEYLDLFMLANDSEGNVHIFHRHGNDYFSYQESFAEFRKNKTGSVA